MRSPKLTFLLAFMLAYPVMFGVTRTMEAAHQSDSVGLWYTIYVAAVFALVAAAVVVGFVLVVAWVRARGFRVTRP